MKPYYSHAGITIYHGDHVLYSVHEAWTEKGLQAIAGTHRQESALGRRAPRMEGRRCD